MTAHKERKLGRSERGIVSVPSLKRPILFVFVIVSPKITVLFYFCLYQPFLNLIFRSIQQRKQHFDKLLKNSHFDLKALFISGFFCTTICCQYLSKISKSGHTDYHRISSFTQISDFIMECIQVEEEQKLIRRIKTLTSKWWCPNEHNTLGAFHGGPSKIGLLKGQGEPRLSGNDSRLSIKRRVRILVVETRWTFFSFIFFFSIKIAQSRPLFRLFLSLQTNIIILQQICEKMSIQYKVLGFKPTTFRTWVSSHNH